MSVAKVIEISSTSTKSFDDAVKEGVATASKTVRNIKSAWVKEMRATVDGSSVTHFQVNLQLTFLLDGNQ